MLPDCAKVYLPPPAGRFGMIFRVIKVKDRPCLAYVAFGVRHHPHDARRSTSINWPTSDCMVSRQGAEQEQTNRRARTVA